MLYALYHPHKEDLLLVDLFAILGCLVTFLVLVIYIGFRFGIITFTVSNELTGESKTFERKEK